MPLSKESLERQLNGAKAQLAGLCQELDDRGIAPEARRKHPKWRELNAACSRLSGRLRTVDNIHTRDAEVLSRRESDSNDDE